MATKKDDGKNTPAVAADIDGSVLVLTFAHGETIRLNADVLRDDIRTAALMHGLKQKLVDAAAIARNTDTGLAATIEDKFYAVHEVYTRITSTDGTWNKIRGDGTGTGSGTGLLVRALMAIFGKSEDAIRAKLDSRSDDEVKALRSSPKVAAKMAELKAAKSNVDVEGLLDSFGA